jgi:hypothetical protein
MRLVKTKSGKTVNLDQPMVETKYGWLGYILHPQGYAVKICIPK